MGVGAEAGGQSGENTRLGGEEITEHVDMIHLAERICIYLWVISRPGMGNGFLASCNNVEAKR